MFKIGEFSRLAHISVRMLRHYDKLGLLMPQFIDEFSGYRYYSAAQLSHAGKIEKLKGMGFSLSTIKEMLTLEVGERADALNHYFEQQKSQLEIARQQLEVQQLSLNHAIQILEGNMMKMNYHVVQKTMPARNVVALRDIVPAYQSEGELWQRLFQHCMAHNPAIQFATEKDSHNIASTFFYDADYKEVDVDIEVQMCVVGEYQSNDLLQFKVVPPLEVVSVTFSGAYEQMADVTETIALWSESNQVKLEGPMFNVYHVSPAQDPNPDNWITEACFCLQPLK